MQSSNKLRNWKAYYAVSILSGLMGVFSKQSAVSLPLSICLYEFYFLWDKKRFNWRYITVFWGIILLVPLIMLITKYLDLDAARTSVLYHPGISVWHYFLTQLRVIITYLRLAVLPLNQNLDYDFPVAQTIFTVPAILSLLFLVLILVLSFRIAGRYKLLTFGIFWFFITLLPESSIFPIKDVIFEHRLYLPMVGFSLFLVSGIIYLVKERNKLAIIVLSLLVCCYSMMTYQRNKVWEDEFSLWDDTVHKSPRKARPYINRGLAYQNQGNLQQAMLDYNKAIEIKPDYAEAYNDRGLIYYSRGEFDQAIADYCKAIEIQPRYAKAYYNRGAAYAAKKEYDQAIADCSKAIEINPYDATAYYNRAATYGVKGEYDRAINDCSKAISINPLDAKAYYNRGVIYALKKEFTLAISDYSQAIKIQPGYAQAYNNRGNIYQDRGEYKQAIADYNKAIASNPKLAQAYSNRALAYYSQGDYNNAWKDIHRLQELGAQVDLIFFNALKEVSGGKRGNQK